MEYLSPVVLDYGDLVVVTQSSGIAGTEDGVGKTVVVGAPGVGDLSVGVLP